jgi:hypothetical protein
MYFENGLSFKIFFQVLNTNKAANLPIFLVKLSLNIDFKKSRKPIKILNY